MFETYQPNENIQIGGPVPQGKIFCSHSSLRFDLQQTESKTTRKQEHDQESDQKKKKRKYALDRESGQEKRKKLFS